MAHCTPTTMSLLTARIIFPRKAACLSLHSDSSFCFPSSVITAAAAHKHGCISSHSIRCFSSSISTKLQCSACVASVATVFLAGAKQALALEDGATPVTGFSLTNPEVMYAVLAIEAIALIGAAVGGTKLSCAGVLYCFIELQGLEGFSGFVFHMSEMW